MPQQPPVGRQTLGGAEGRLVLVRVVVVQPWFFFGVAALLNFSFLVFLTFLAIVFSFFKNYQRSPCVKWRRLLRDMGLRFALVAFLMRGFLLLLFLLNSRLLMDISSPLKSVIVAKTASQKTSRGFKKILVDVILITMKSQHVLTY